MIASEFLSKRLFADLQAPSISNTVCRLLLFFQARSFCEAFRSNMAVQMEKVDEVCTFYE